MAEMLYSSTATTFGGLEGKVQSADGVINMATALPGTNRDEKLDNVTNPEQLFAAAYATCFDSALQIVANKESVNLESQVTAKVNLLEDEQDGYKLTVDLQIKGANIDKTKLEDLVQKANQIWPYSEDKRRNMDFNLQIESLSH
ncbi:MULTISPECIES: Ohr family peroxiredoxin [Lysinibacillus]|uniref:Ohr family peroxiredoxin n=1 Tax=Lysinibacillus antri TaxID=2498145 RepID=A0A3S0RKB9_9BACI|nr:MULTISPECIES: Ohr family peroxiredoxin [Lysinibacillus]RUL54649.1 Ohr family peroxiredoxin [Lysinibacillus antri]TSI11068.1 Ohr family peroxiredoxin [Lysinibacillus sp. BW-2-10]